MFIFHKKRYRLISGIKRALYHDRALGNKDSRLVRRAESYFPGKMLYVFREQHKNKEFYKSLGFTKTDTWVHSLL